MTLHDEINPVGAGACGCDSCERERTLEADVDYQRQKHKKAREEIEALKAELAVVRKAEHEWHLDEERLREALKAELEYARTMLLPEVRQTFYDDVRAFHSSWHSLQASPRLLTGDEWARRVRLISEEFSELAKAHAFGDLVGFADGVVDLAWVVLGTAVEAGLPFNALWREVRRANMEKFRDGVKLDSTGKILKPTGWRQPDIKGVLAKARKEDSA